MARAQLMQAPPAFPPSMLGPLGFLRLQIEPPQLAPLSSAQQPLLQQEPLLLASVILAPQLLLPHLLALSELRYHQPAAVILERGQVQHGPPQQCSLQPVLLRVLASLAQRQQLAPLRVSHHGGLPRQVAAAAQVEVQPWQECLIFVRRSRVLPARVATTPKLWGT